MKTHPPIRFHQRKSFRQLLIPSLVILGSLLFCQVGWSTTYYVSTTGNNLNDGLTPQTAFRTIQRAADAANTPGDVVLVANGEYEAFRIEHSGSPTAFIRFAAQNRRGAKITGQDWQDGIKIAADFIEIDGFEVTAGQQGINGESRHHLRIINNHAHNCGKSGISLGHNPNDPWYPSDYYWVEGNLCHNNAWRDWHSGISVYQAIEYTPAPGETAPWPGHRIVIRNNICHSNFTFSGRHTDGNGIIIDDFNFTQNATLLAMDGTPYSYGALVENNLCYDNGGAGIKVVWSDNILVRNNTVYGNNLDPLDTGTYRGGFYVQQSRGCVFVNNIAWGNRTVNPSNSAIMDRGIPSGNVTTPNLWINNLTWMGGVGDNGIDEGDGNSSTFVNNLLAVNPQFVDIGARNFRLSTTSPAINMGTQAQGTAFDGLDLDGLARIAGGEINLGPYEYQISGPIALTGLSISPAVLNLTPGQTGQLGAVYAPTNTSERTVSWSSSTPGVASVLANGTVQALQPGLAFVTLSSVENPAITSQAEVRVFLPSPPPIALEAEAFSQSSPGIVAWSTGIGSIGGGNWVAYNNVDFGDGRQLWTVRLATGLAGTLQLRSGSSSGPILATLNFSATPGWDSFQEFSVELPSLTGVQNVVMVGGSGTANIDRISFSGDPASTYAGWRAVQFTAGELANPLVGGALADPDFDGVTNLMEYALGTNPKVYNPSTITMEIPGGTQRAWSAFFRARSDIRYVAEFSDDLTNWRVVENPGQAGEHVIAEDLETAPAFPGRRFFRLRTELQPPP